MTTAETTDQVEPAEERAPLDLSVIKAVAFDAYGTLFHWDFILTVQEVLDQQGLGGDHEEVAKTFQDEAFRKVSVWAEHSGEDGKLDRKRLADGPPLAFRFGPLPARDVQRRAAGEAADQRGRIGEGGDEGG